MKRRLDRNDEEDTEISVRKRINFEAESDDNEVVIDTHAHKKRKMSREMEELKLWITDTLSTKEQTQQLIDNINNNTIRGKKNEEDIAEIKQSIHNIERHIGVQASTEPTVGSYAGAAMRPRPPAPSIPKPIPPQPTYNADERKSFYLSRRSLRLWPIEGNNNEELMSSTIAFCTCLLYTSDAADE